MRYTECRLAPIAMEMVRDIDKETVDFRPNYDGRAQEPLVLPARFPNLLVNGSAGIAVGMATSIPPHNLGEVAEGAQWALEHPDASREVLGTGGGVVRPCRSSGPCRFFTSTRTPFGSTACDRTWHVWLKHSNQRAWIYCC